MSNILSDVNASYKLEALKENTAKNSHLPLQFSPELELYYVNNWGERECNWFFITKKSFKVMILNLLLYKPVCLSFYGLRGCCC